MALSMMLGEEGIEPDSIKTDATVIMEQDDSGFTITEVQLKTVAKIPGAEQATFDSAARRPRKGARSPNC